ncbi:hypothetical protein Emag_000129 [Eimeria magna]
MSGNFYKGTSKEQTPFFKDKDSQLIAQRKWPEIFEQEVDMSKVNVEVMKAWINHKITELLGFEDDIVISYCLSQLVPEEALAADVDERRNYLCPKKLAISLTGFVGKQATHFVRELWKLLLSAQAARINEELVRRHEQMMATEFNKQIKQFATGTAPPKPPTLVACRYLKKDRSWLVKKTPAFRAFSNSQYCVEFATFVPRAYVSCEKRTGSQCAGASTSTDDTIPDSGGGMRGWDNDDAPAARARAPEAAVGRVEEVAEHGGRDQIGGEAGVVASLEARLARPAEAKTGIETVVVGDQATKTELDVLSL